MCLSIIIPVHNTGQYLAECLDSVLSEINTNDEVILVENGSTDHSWEICQKYSEKYNTVKAFQLETAGVSKARNYGICRAKGDWITFLDSDDCLDPSIIHIARKLNHSDIDAVLFSYSYLDAPHPEAAPVSKTLKYVDSDLLRRGVLQFGKYENQIRKVADLDNISIWSCWGKLFRKRLIDEKMIRFPERLFLSEDTAFVFQVFCSTDKIYAAQMNAYFYRVTPNSVSRRVTFKTISNNNYLRKWMMQYVLSHGLEKMLEEEVSAFLVRKFIEECLYLKFFKEKSRTEKLQYVNTNVGEPYMKKALYKVHYRWLIPGKRNTLSYGIALWFLKRKCFRGLFIGLEKQGRTMDEAD